MSCLTSLEFSTESAGVAMLWLICALVLARIAVNNRFAGKPAFIFTFVAMLWWLFTVTFDFASQGLTCKVGWSLAAWPGITLLPIAWSLFIFDYTMNSSRVRKPIRLFCYLVLPALVSIIALANDQTHLLYGTDTRMIGTGPDAYVRYDHGPVFFVIALGLYVFIASALGVLAYAMIKAKKNIRPFLGTLMIITVAPLVANMGYVGWEITVFGFDPTPFAFAVALIAFSWLLLNNTMMDTEAQGRNLLFYATHDPVLIIDAGGRFAGANAAAKALFGQSLPRNGGSVAHLDKVGPLLGPLIESDDLISAEPVKFDERVFELRSLPIESPIQTRKNLLGWTVSLVDITERERSAEALREAVVRAEAANHAKSQFLAMISHELRTPMTSVKGGLDLVLNGVAGDISDPTRNLLNIAQRNSQRLLRLIDDVLDLQKLELSTIVLNPRDLDADKLLHNILEEYEAYAAKADVRLTVLTDDIGVKVHADPDRLRQVVGNVISNAVKFSPEESSVACSYRLVGSRLRLSIRDSGIGIPDDEEDHVFGRFNQVKNSYSGGSGLGMHIAKLLIERMGGAISYESRLGEGTIFHIDMALSPPERQGNAVPQGV